MVFNAESVRHRIYTTLSQIDYSMSQLVECLNALGTGIDIDSVTDIPRFFDFEMKVRRGLPLSFSDVSAVFTDPIIINAVLTFYKLFWGNKRNCNNEYPIHAIRCLTAFKRIEVGLGLKSHANRPHKLVLLWHDFLEDIDLANTDVDSCIEARRSLIKSFTRDYGESIFFLIQCMTYNKKTHGPGLEGYERYVRGMSDESLAMYTKHKDIAVIPFRTKLLDAADNIRTCLHTDYVKFEKTLKKNIIILSAYIDNLRHRPSKNVRDSIEVSIMLYFVKETTRAMTWRLTPWVTSLDISIADYYDNYIVGFLESADAWLHCVQVFSEQLNTPPYK